MVFPNISHNIFGFISSTYFLFCFLIYCIVFHNVLHYVYHSISLKYFVLFFLIYITMFFNNQISRICRLTWTVTGIVSLLPRVLLVRSSKQAIANVSIIAHIWQYCTFCCTAPVCRWEPDGEFAPFRWSNLNQTILFESQRQSFKSF